ncbi:hypothetical protein AGOR_G00064470 [Albula goreensis]|uniref:Uncharacterized protein n=1 Tax=Albula goreensis TaxID=1534307 RepID=A0A8T3DTL7_9TELE|nr:hypothetical protein AGOR_G00064470 [Albula goreensis]
MKQSLAPREGSSCSWFMLTWSTYDTLSNLISPPLPGSAVPMRCSTAPQFEVEGDRCRLVNTGIRQGLSSSLIQEVRGQQSAETCSTFWLLEAPSDRGAGGVFQGKRPPMYPTAWDALTFGRNSRGIDLHPTPRSHTASPPIRLFHDSSDTPAYPVLMSDSSKILSAPHPH